MEFQRQHSNTESYDEEFKKLSFTSLTDLELDALNSLDETIRCHETTDFEDVQFDKRLQNKVEKLERRNTVTFQKSSKQVTDSTKASHPRKLNTGYILFDGAEIKYISTDESEPDLPVKPSEQVCAEGSFRSGTSESSTHVSELPSHLNLSSDDLIMRDSFKDTISRISLTPHKRLPAYVHFSTMQKLYLFLVGAVPVLAVNAFYISIAFFLPVLGKQSLSEIGICYHVPFLASLLLIFCGKKHWVPFLPTVPICLVLMAVSVVVLPSFVAAGFTLSIFAIYGVIIVNGLCAGLSQSLVSRMVVLFPGGKSILLIRYGESIGSLFPMVVQIILILSMGLRSTESQLTEYNTRCLYVLFGVVFLGIIIGLVSLIKLSKSGIYALFAGRDCIAHSPKNITLGSVPETAKRRYHTVKWYLVVEFLLSLVSYFVLSLAPFIHEATLQTSNSSTVPFWKVYLATVLIGLFRVGDIFGRIMSNLCCGGQRTMNKDVAMFVYLSASILRLAFIPAVVFYTRSPFLVYHNVFMMGFYFMLAFTNGFLSVAMTSRCQSLIRVQRNDTCPIVSQFIWFSGLFGATIGIALSFVQLTYDLNYS